MDILYTPWRMAYLTGGLPPSGCLFCELPAHADPEALIVHRGTSCYVVLNRFPYSNGHLMVTPFAHRPDLGSLTRDERLELLELGARCEEALRAEYRPHAFNMGLNLGKSAGAGVDAHLHLHVVPRWEGDTSFMTVLAGTRTVPEDLDATHARLAARFASAASSA